MVARVIPELIVVIDPPTISGLVIALLIWVSVDLQTRRPGWKHVVPEIDEFQPSRCDLNAFGAIPRIADAAWSVAAANHIAPHCVKWVSRHAVNPIAMMAISLIRGTFCDSR